MIHPGRGKGRIRLLAAVFILFAAAALYGRGAKEDSFLSRADELIANKEYDEALRILTDYLQDNPDRFGEAQKRLQKIVQLRERYNKVANDLLDLIRDDPANDEKILSLVNLLLTIESPNNPATRRFLDQVRYLAEFNVNKNRLERILADARAQLAQNDFSGAMDTYASGLDLYQNTYFTSGYGKEAEDIATEGLKNISLNMQTFRGLMDPFSKAVLALTGLGAAPNSNELSQAHAGLVRQIDDLSVLLGDFNGIRSSYDTQLEILQRDFDVKGDTSFLSFAGRLITGPVGQHEGMTGVLEHFWDYYISQADDYYLALVDRSYNSCYLAMVNRDYQAGLGAIDGTAQYISAALDHLKACDPFLVAAGTESNVIYGETVSDGLTGKYLKLRSMDLALGYLGEAGKLGNRSRVLENPALPTVSSWQQGIMTTQAAVSQEQNTRRSYQEMVNEAGVLSGKAGADIDTLMGYVNSLANVPGGTGTPQSYLADVRNMVTSLGLQFRSFDLASGVRQYTVANGDIEKRVIEREKEFADGSARIQGVSRESEEKGVYTAYYPTEGLAILTGMTGNLETDIQSARALLSQYTAEPRTVLEAPKINALYVSAQDMLNRLLSLQTRSNTVMAGARTQVERANALRFEGDRLFQAAQAALNRNDPTTAMSSLSRSSEQYNASLAIQESDTLRAAWDAQGQRLGAEIVRVENEIVVRDVRNLLNSARTYYFAGNMEQAETALVNAQNRWRVTNVIDQPEVEYWLNLVRGAMSIQSSRTIPPTAPLYAEMSQLLSDASRNYNEGVRSINEGRRQEGIARFNEARDKTREVRLIFPLNQSARMLELRIEQQLDPVAFNATFRQRLNDAVAGTKAKNLQAFADLQDLAEINPRYPGIQAILTQAEYDMEIRQPPPDPRDLARSTELSRNAQTVINARDSIRYEAARTWLAEAVRLNPNNAQAQALTDQLNLLMYGTGTIYLPAYAQDLYNQALQEFTRGNYLTANSIVVRLLQNPEYQKSTQIQELKRWIDAVL